MFVRRARVRELEARIRIIRERKLSEERRQDVARAWKTGGDATAERIRAEYEAGLAALKPRTREWALPIAAWYLREGDPGVDDSYVGGFPALRPTEDWPALDGSPLRFWAQVNLAQLAPYADAYGIRMPHGGLIQLFAGEDGGELARYVPLGERLEVRREMPAGFYWDDTPRTRGMVQTSLLVDLYPEVLVRWNKVDDDADLLTPDDLPGYSFGYSQWQSAPEPGEHTFLATVLSRDELGLMYSDMGHLWAVLPTADLEAGDFSRLACAGESS